MHAVCCYPELPPRGLRRWMSQASRTREPVNAFSVSLP
jgi:hypothetical protein